MRFLRCTAGALVLLAIPCLAQESPQSYPSRPVRFIVPASVGGPTDAIGRMVGDRLGQALGQAVIVENRPGASATLGPAAVAKAPADGYMLLFTSSTPMVMVTNTMKNVPYDVQKDFAAVSVVGASPLMVCVNASSPITNLAQLVAEIKAKPESASYGSYGNGTSAHIMMEMLIKQAGVQMVHVPYKGIAPGLQDLMGGSLMTSVSDIGTALPLIRGGKIRAIAIASGKRSALVPDVATFAEQGIRGMEPFAPWFGVFAPAGTPQPIVNRLSSELVKIAKSPEFIARLTSFGTDPAAADSAQAHDILINDFRNWQSMVKDLSHIQFE